MIVEPQGNGQSWQNAKHDAHPLSWAAIAGRWKFQGSHALYEGPSKTAVQPYGIAVCNRTLTDGKVRARVKLSSIEQEGRASGGLLLGFQSESSRYLIIQLGAYGYAYSIAEFIPGTAWRSVANAGSASNLISGHEYELEVQSRGEQIHLVVDSVPVLDHVLHEPLLGSQVGLFGWGTAEIAYDKFSVDTERPRVFVAMQFAEPFNTLYNEVIRPQAEGRGFEVVRIDEIAGPGVIFEDIKREISEARVVIAEITAPNQNVFYELGYAHALNKPTILLAQRGKELPFDIRSYRVIFYDDSIAGKPTVERNLHKHLDAVMND